VRDDLNAIPVFVTVVESGNFASAAAILHVTRSAVGKTIARLEARLGVALFQRTTRRQLLTEEGEQFYLQCREALERIREAEETLQRGKDEVQGRLRVSLPVLFGGRVPAPAASAADYCRVERAPYPRLSAQRPAAKMATV